MEPGKREEESIEGSERQILKPLETGTASSTLVIWATNEELEMREGKFREACWHKEERSCGCWCCVLEGVVMVALDDNDDCCVLECFFLCFELEVEGIV